MRVQNLEHALQLETRRAVQPAIGLAEPQRPFARLAPGRVFTGEREERLLEAIEMQIPLLLREGGDLLVKILEGPEAQIVDRRIRMRFKSAYSRG